MKLEEQKTDTQNSGKKVTLLIVSSSGHDEKTMTAGEALREITTQVKDKGKFCYLDNEYVDIKDLGIGDIQSAEDIVLTAALGGG